MAWLSFAFIRALLPKDAIPKLIRVVMSPAGAIVCILLMWFASGWWHTRVANARCEERIEKSVEEAKRMDTAEKLIAAERAALDRAANQQLAATLEHRIADYAKQLRDAQSCAFNRDPLDFGRVPEYKLPAIGPKPASRK